MTLPLSMRAELAARELTHSANMDRLGRGARRLAPWALGAGGGLLLLRALAGGDPSLPDVAPDWNQIYRDNARRSQDLTDEAVPGLLRRVWEAVSDEITPRFVTDTNVTVHTNAGGPPIRETSRRPTFAKTNGLREKRSNQLADRLRAALRGQPPRSRRWPSMGRGAALGLGGLGVVGAAGLGGLGYTLSEVMDAVNAQLRTHALQSTARDAGGQMTGEFNDIGDALTLLGRPDGEPWLLRGDFDSDPPKLLDRIDPGRRGREMERLGGPGPVARAARGNWTSRIRADAVVPDVEYTETEYR